MRQPDVDKMLREISAAQFVEWQAYYDGIGETDNQLDTATMVTMFVNELRHLRYRMERLAGNDKAKPDKRLKVKQVIRKWRLEEKAKVKVRSTEELYRMFKQRG